MGIGEVINKNPIVGVIIAVVILGIAGYVMMSTSGGGGGKQIDQRYYYDLSTGELTAMGNEPAPVTAASGSQAVWAHVFSCGSCEDESQRFVAYLQKLTDEAKQESTKPLKQQDSDIIMAGGRVALPPKEPGGEIAWIPADSAEGMRIGQAPLSLCPGGTPKLCQP